MTQYTYLGQSLLALERAAKQQHEGGVSNACVEDTPREDAPRADPERASRRDTERTSDRDDDRVSSPRRDVDGRAKATEVPGRKGLTPPRRTDSR